MSRTAVIAPFRRRSDRVLVPLRTGIGATPPNLGPTIGLIGGTDVDACCARPRCRCACGCLAHSHYRRCQPCAAGAHAGPTPAWREPLACQAARAFGDWPPAGRLDHLLAVAS